MPEVAGENRLSEAGLAKPVIFFDDAGVGANMVGAFASITDSLFSAYKGNLKQNNANLWVYQVGP